MGEWKVLNKYYLVKDPTAAATQEPADHGVHDVKSEVRLASGRC